MNVAAEAQPIWAVIASTKVGTVVGIISVLCGICSVASVGAIKVYKLFYKYTKSKEETESYKETVNRLNERDELIMAQLRDINQKLSDQEDIKIKELRHTLVTTGEAAIVNGYMTIRSWSSWMELFNVYFDLLKQNSYVESLKKKIDKGIENGTIKILGKLDEHGNDIE